MLQSLIEKHFPAPDRKKLYSLLGIDLTAPSNNSSPRDSPCKENKIKKRKGGYFSLNGAGSSINLSILMQAVFWECTAFLELARVVLFLFIFFKEVSLFIYLFIFMATPRGSQNLSSLIRD